MDSTDVHRRFREICCLREQLGEQLKEPGAHLS